MADVAELSPQSSVDARLAAALIKLARMQVGIRKQQLPRHTEWIDAVPDVERPRSATQLLIALLDSDEAPYQGEAIENKHLDVAIAVGRKSWSRC